MVGEERQWEKGLIREALVGRDGDCSSHCHSVESKYVLNSKDL